MKSNLEVIGRNVLVTFRGSIKDVPAKVDTGADGSSVWATDIYVDEAHHLHFVLFDKGSEYYTGEEIVTDDYSVAKVRSSSGHTQIRYRAALSVDIAGHHVKVRFTLADRHKNLFPILIGRRTLAKRFVVDVSQSEYNGQTRVKTRRLNDELQKNPHEFYKKYHQNNIDSDKVKK